ncbi:MAG: hypothetical protein RLZZ283_756 [Candidatus Parcubacteria bacterium]
MVEQGKFKTPASRTDAAFRISELDVRIRDIRHELSLPKPEGVSDVSHSAWLKRAKGARFAIEMERKYLLRFDRLEKAKEEFGRSPFDIFGSVKE